MNVRPVWPRHLMSGPQLRHLEPTVGLHDKADGLVPGFVLGAPSVNITLTMVGFRLAGRDRNSPSSIGGRDGLARVRVEGAVTNPSGLASTLDPAGSGNLNLPDVPEPSPTSRVGVRVAGGGGMKGIGADQGFDH
jgi:hypothetical protein